MSGIGGAARRNGFWLLDRLRGGPVRRHYEEVRSVIAGQDPHALEDPLPSLLEHATGTTAFYGPYRGLGPERYPVIDKATVKADPGAFRSRTFEGVELHRAESSGSTGEPIVVYQDPRKRRRSIADTIAFNELAGLRLGDRLMWLFAARLVPMSRRKQFLQNIVPMDHVGLDDEASARVVARLAEGRVDAMLGINSTYQVLARSIESRGVDAGRFGLRTVIATGEDLIAEERERISRAFACPVVNRYSTEEHGILACTAPAGDRLLLNRASYRFEFLHPQRDEPRAPGELARVVITDLFNRATPLIRYDTGDLAVVAEVDQRGEAVALSSVAGRRRDVIYDTSGGQVPSTSVSGILVRAFPQLRRYQLVQEERTRYRVLVVQGDERYAEADIAATMRRWLGQDATIEVEAVADIAPLSSGKHRPVVRSYEPPGATPVRER